MEEQKKEQNWSEELLRAQMLARMTQEDIRSANDNELLWQRSQYHRNPQNMTFQELIKVDDL